MENHQTKFLRYERKFFVSNIDRDSVESIIRQHPSFFSEIFYERYINNIYFDFLELNNFYDNVNGTFERRKFRIRWYGEMLSVIEHPILEQKIRIGLLGEKESYPIKPFSFSSNMNTSIVKEIIQESDISEKTKDIIKEQYPLLLNNYRRKYFESSDKKFRITIDDKQSFYKINSFNNRFLNRSLDSTNTIIELKYNAEFEPEAKQITNRIPFRLTKSSKYARGIELLYS